MDQTVSAHAIARHALLFETGEDTRRQVPLDLPVLLVETGVSHRLADGEYNRRRAECVAALEACRAAGSNAPALAAVPEAALEQLQSRMPDVLFRRLRHVVRETARTRAAALALTTRDFPRVGHFLLEGHASIRDDFESSCGEADRLVASAVRHGAWGARLTGGGWGGTVLIMAPPERYPALSRAVAADFRRETGKAPTMWTVRAAGGLRTERGW